MLVLWFEKPSENRLPSPQRKAAPFMGRGTGEANYSNGRSPSRNPKKQSQKRGKKKKEEEKEKERRAQRRSQGTHISSETQKLAPHGRKDPGP